jgi:hypothetical protein
MNLQQKWRNTQANRAMTTPKISRKYPIQLRMFRKKQYSPRGYAVVLFAFRQSRPDFWFMQVPCA